MYYEFMNKTFIINMLEDKYIEKLKVLSPPRVHNTESELIYEGHSPTAGYLLVEGVIHFSKRKQIVQTAKPGSLFGVVEVINHTPIKYTVRIQPGSKVCILDKSTIKEVLQNIEENDLPEVFKNLVA